MDIHGTAWCAIVAGRASDVSILLQRMGCRFQHTTLFISQRLEVTHHGYIVQHLSHVRHATEYHHNIGQ